MDVDSDAKDEDKDMNEDEVVDWCTYVNTFDVCITTYNVLQQDLGVARPPPTRPRRAFVQYSTVHRTRSPLVMCEWYRVIMDEVQMVGGGKTEYVGSVLRFRRGLTCLNAQGDGVTWEAKEGSPILNLGIRNNVVAIQWIKQHISVFGGDPNEVLFTTSLYSCLSVFGGDKS